MKSLEVKGYGPADIPIIRETGRIAVTGYDTGLARDVVVEMLKNLFSSCGEITDVYIYVIDDNRLSKYAYIYFMEKSAVDKALQLNGSNLGGSNKAVVEAIPVPDIASRFCGILVQGFDTSLDRDDIKNALSKHYSSCGRVSEVIVHDRINKVIVYIDGENAAQKALKLGVTSIEGRKVVAKLITTPINPTVHRRRVYGGRHRIEGYKAATTVE